MFQKVSIFITAILFFQNAAFAWNWKDASQQAIVKNPDLQSRLQNSEIFHLRYENAKSYRYPRLTLVGAYTQFEDESKTYEYRAYLGPRFQWLLYQGGKISSGIDRAEAVQRGANAEVKKISVSINSKLRQAFANALRAKNYLELAHRVEKQRMENVKLTEIRYRSGLEYKWVFMSSTVKWKKAQLETQKAEMNKRTALADLQNLLGALPVQSVEELDETDFYADDVTYDLDKLLLTVKKNPDYIVQQAKVEEGQYNIDYNQADRYPTIGFQADFLAVSNQNEDIFPFWYSTLGLSMPLFEAGRIKRNISIAKQTLAQRQFDLQQVELDIQSSLEKNYLEYTISKQQVDISRMNVEVTKDRSKVVSNQYRSGLTTFLDWESSQDGWVNSEIELLDNIRNFQVSRARLEESMGIELQP